MRKLAREAVIFMLLGMLLTAVGGFLLEHHDQWRVIRSQREALRKNCNIGLIPFRFGEALSNTDGTSTTQPECALVFGEAQYPRPRDLSPTVTPPEPAGWTLVVPSPHETAALAEGERIKNLSIDNEEAGGVALLLAPWGFLGGLGLWIFYRLVRFAIKG